MGHWLHGMAHRTEEIELNQAAAAPNFVAIWPVRVMCETLRVSPSGYYAWRSRPDSLRKIANRDLLADIRRVHAQHQERYGAPRVHAELRAKGHTVSRKRSERASRPHGLPAR